MRSEPRCGARSRPGQSGVVSSLSGLGAKVLGQYQDAYDGVKVQVAAGKIAGIAKLPGVVAVQGLRLHGRQPVRRPVHRRADGMGFVWRDRCGRQDRDDRHRHRLHACQLRRLGHPAAYAAQNSTGRWPTADSRRAEGRRGHRLRRQRLRRRPERCDLPTVPHPDPDPLDCGGHGSHTAGTAAGYGVLSNGTTYTGAYNPAAISSQFLDDRAGSRAAGHAVRLQASSVVRLDRRRRRRHRLGSRRRHGRHQHVPRLALRRRRTIPTRSRPTMRRRPACSSSPRPATRARARR